MPTPSHTRLTDKAKRLVQQALKEDFVQTNEHVTYDVVVAVFPDPSAGGDLDAPGTDPSQLALLPVLSIYLELAGAAPDTSVYMVTILAPYQVTVSRVSKLVRDSLVSLRETREKQQEALDSEAVEAS